MPKQSSGHVLCVSSATRIQTQAAKRRQRARVIRKPTLARGTKWPDRTPQDQCFPIRLRRHQAPQPPFLGDSQRARAFACVRARAFRSALRLHKRWRGRPETTLLFQVQKIRRQLRPWLLPSHPGRSGIHIHTSDFALAPTILSARPSATLTTAAWTQAI